MVAVPGERVWKIEGPKRALRISHRPPDSPMGRFGGGWQWEVGVQVGPRSVIVNCLVFTIRYDRRRVTS
ncbi:hypothetical protein [Mycobacterium sp.]|uniref:hypothetical protein n=1 Tax=Mycobacterium sp. TaxID=1785 RepID=UPI0026147EF2|nr:hypothetical protein [Mycobacterium sp.]